MKNDRALSDRDPMSIAVPTSAWSRFWFTPIAPTGLHVLRVLSGLVFLAWLLAFLGHQAEFFSLSGWIDKGAFFAMQRQLNLAPAPISWSILYLAGENPAMLQALYWGSIAVLALFTLGVATRITGVLTWVVVASFAASPASSFDGDSLLVILAFYLMIAYLLTGLWNGQLSPIEKLIGSSDHMLWVRPDERQPSIAANVVLRLVQIQVALILVTSGLNKLQMSDWWTGVALWYPMHRPFETTAEGLRREIASRETTFFFLSLATYVVLAWQIGFPLFAWRRGWWRAVLLGGAAAGWLGMTFLYRLPLFGPFFAVGCLSYLRPEEWASIGAQLRGIVGTRAVAAPVKVAAKV